MAQTTDLTNHIADLLKADADLIGKLHKEWFYVGIPKTFPSIYIDSLFLVDDKLDSWRFNISFVTTDMSLTALDTAIQIKTALQQSHCIAAQGINPRPEPENKRSRYLIPCIAYMKSL